MKTTAICLTVVGILLAIGIPILENMYHWSSYHVNTLKLLGWGFVCVGLGLYFRKPKDS